ncbi:hypothetical protein BH23GEM2_BH23GEM2_23420 [soil metagenome]
MAVPTRPSPPITAEPTQSVPPLTFSVWVAGILRRRRLAVGIIALTMALAVALGLLLPPSYVAWTSFVANASSNRLPNLPVGGPLQGLTSQLGLGNLSEPSESPAFYAQLVQSQELRRRLATSLFANPRTGDPADSADFIAILRPRQRDPLRRMEIAVDRLGSAISVGSDPRTSLVSVTAQSRWPELAAALANRTVDLVAEFNAEQRVSRAHTKRVFLENRLTSAQMDLQSTEERQRRFYEQNRAWRNSPALVFEEGRLRRNVELASNLYITLRQQLEMARLEEFNDAALITVVDRAVVPRKARWPRWGMLLVSSMLVGVFVAMGVAGSAVILEDWRRRNPVSASFFRESLPAFRSRRHRGQAPTDTVTY